MKLIRFDGWRVGVTDGIKIVDVSDLCGAAADEWPPVSINRLIRDFDRLRPQIATRLARDEGIPFAGTRLETPVPWPNKLLAYPVNYHDHAAEMATKGLANIQGFFLKANSSLSGPHDPIELPALPGRQIHHECEIGLIIGRQGREIPPEKALDHVFGYCCLLDITVRGKEERVMRKSYETFTPIGPWIVTKDELPDPGNVDMRLWVNEELRQSANTRDLIVDIPQMIAIASSATTLYPGDVFATGTPAGVGPIVDGDVVTIDITGVGKMSVPVVQGTRGHNIVFAKPYDFQKAPI